MAEKHAKLLCLASLCRRPSGGLPQGLVLTPRNSGLNSKEKYGRDLDVPATLEELKQVG